MKQLACRHCTWLGMDTQIEQIMSQCHACVENQFAQPQMFSTWPKSQSSWQCVHIDFAGSFWNTCWLIVVDFYSKFPFAVLVKSTTSHSTYQVLSSIVSFEDVPKLIVLDNGAGPTNAAVANAFYIVVWASGGGHVPFWMSSGGHFHQCTGQIVGYDWKYHVPCSHSFQSVSVSTLLPPPLFSCSIYNDSPSPWRGAM
ncbi:uncharacterized protein K02A2.6-like [Schistocerca cancellata]|uniref:uncharacterized protein K02A2.6-like n=1 Tax=Schistocerca cancellata TaxID=274614 RepID=UPI0021192073|nr:uncharacterized protein K02A2.6-like [Schistocerca cancellata]